MNLTSGEQIPPLPTEQLFFTPAIYKPDSSGMSWKISTPTYDPRTHQRGVVHHFLDMNIFGVSDVGFAHSLVALPRLGLVTLQNFYHRLTSYGNLSQGIVLDRPFNRITAFVKATNPPDYDESFESKMQGFLTGVAVSEVINDFNLGVFLDRVAVPWVDQKPTTRALDSFVTFYNRSRDLVLAHAKNFSSRRARQQSFSLFLDLLKTFATDAAAVLGDDIYNPNIVFDVHGQLSLPTDRVDSLQELYDGEIEIGEMNLQRLVYGTQTPASRHLITNPDSSVEIQNLATGDTETEDVTGYNPDLNRTGRCPFFAKGYVKRGLGWFSEEVEKRVVDPQ